MFDLLIYYTVFRVILGKRTRMPSYGVRYAIKQNTKKTVHMIVCGIEKGHFNGIVEIDHISINKI